MKSRRVTIPMNLELDVKQNIVNTIQTQVINTQSQPINRMRMGIFKNLQNTKSCGSCGK